MSENYFYGLTAMMYLTTCWMFSAIRWFHTCRAPKKEHRYIWPDRKLQCFVYLCATVLLPYVFDPTNPSAWTLYKAYFPTCYYFYCGVLLLCFFGTVKQWSQWRTVSWAAAAITIGTMLPLMLNAWLPTGILSASGLQVWKYVVMTTSIIMMGYAAIAMWQVKHWMDESRDANYSNPDDFPSDYAHRVWLAPIIFTPLLWPAYLLDSPAVMAVQSVLLAVMNIVLLLNVMPVWRRRKILSTPDSDNGQDSDDVTNSQEDLIDQTAIEIEAYVHDSQSFLNPHLKIDDVVDHCQTGRSYVSLTFSRRFGSFAAYVNGLRLEHYEQYLAQHPEETKESAALASGFSSYTACYRAKQKYSRSGKSK